jgi:hypothetical protein
MSLKCLFTAAGVGAMFFVSLPATSSAQIPGKVAFNTVSYNIGGAVSATHSLENPSTVALPLFGNDLKQRSGIATEESGYNTFPIELKATVANTAMTAKSKAEGNVVFDMKAETGALRVTVDGFLSASSTSNQAIADASIVGTAVAQARWQDTGRFTRLVDPQPGRIAILESDLDLSGLISIENTGTPPFFSSSRLAGYAANCIYLTAVPVCL